MVVMEKRKVEKKKMDRKEKKVKQKKKKMKSLVSILEGREKRAQRRAEVFVKYEVHSR